MILHSSHHTVRPPSAWKRMLLACLLVLLVLSGACGHAPAEPAEPAGGTEPNQSSISLTIDVRTLLGRIDDLDPAKQAYVPDSGYMLQDEAVDFEAGLTAFDALIEAAGQQSIVVDYSRLGGAYVEGIGQIYEGDCGQGSGWLYAVNGETPDRSAALTELEAGDVVAWIYTCDMGRDIGLDAPSLETATVAVSLRNDVKSAADGAAWEGALLDEAEVLIEQGDTMAAVLARAAEANDIEISGLQDGFVTAVDGLGEGAAYPEGWNSFLNDWAHDQAITDMPVRAGDSISLEYSLDGGADIGSVWGSDDQSLAELIPSTGTLEPAFASNVTDYTLSLEETGLLALTASAANRQYQVRIYPDELDAAADGFRSGKAISTNGIERLIVAVAQPAWPTMSTAGPGTVYTISLAKDAAAAESAATEPTDLGSAENSAPSVPVTKAADDPGTLVWSRQIGTDWTDAPSQAALAGDRLYLMTGSSLVTLDASTGEEMQRADMAGVPSWGTSAPAYADGRVFTALTDGILQAFSADPLEPAWTYTAELGGQAVVPVTTGEGVVVTGFWNGDGLPANLVVLDQVTGELLWSVESPGGYYGAGTLVHDGKLYSGADMGADAAVSRFSVYDLATGELLDEMDVEGHQRSGVVLADDSLYFTSKAGLLYETALDENGLLGETRTTQLPGPSTSTPAVSAERVYVGSADPADEFGPGSLSVYDRASATLRYYGILPGPVGAAPLIGEPLDDGTTPVYFTVNAEAGSLYVLFDDVSADTGELRSFFTPPEEQQNYSLSSPLAGTDAVYYGNDSGAFFALAAAEH